MKSLVYEVEWVDSCAHHGWRDEDEEFPVSFCRTSGYLIHRDKTRVTIASSQDATSGHVSDIITIPRSAIRKVRRLK
jgi:hypothetical protein